MLCCSAQLCSCLLISKHHWQGKQLLLRHQLLSCSCFCHLQNQDLSKSPVKQHDRQDYNVTAHTLNSEICFHLPLTGAAAAHWHLKLSHKQTHSFLPNNALQADGFAGALPSPTLSHSHFPLSLPLSSSLSTFSPHTHASFQTTTRLQQSQPPLKNLSRNVLSQYVTTFRMLLVVIACQGQYVSLVGVDKAQQSRLHDNTVENNCI